MKTSDFRTKTIFSEIKNPVPAQEWPIAIDIGYSSVKAYAPNAIYSFPSYAVNIGKNPQVKGITPEMILYRDKETGDQWIVGAEAQRMLEENAVDSSRNELIGRQRYYSDTFRILYEVGLALGLLPTANGVYDGRSIYVQTGLPAEYIADDKDEIISVFSGDHSFAIKTASTGGRFVEYNLSIGEHDVGVMSQPDGTLMSLSYDDNATPIKDAMKYFKAKTLMIDIGFGTLDAFDIKGGRMNSQVTLPYVGMEAVLNRTSELIKDEYGVTVKSFAMQTPLETGVIKKTKRVGRTITSVTKDFTAQLMEANSEICDKALDKIMNSFSVDDYRYLVVTGGTSAAWFDKILDRFKYIEGLEIIKGNDNCPSVDPIFCNVRGYYLSCVKELKSAWTRKNAS